MTVDVLVEYALMGFLVGSFFSVVSVLVRAMAGTIYIFFENDTKE